MALTSQPLDAFSYQATHSHTPKLKNKSCKTDLIGCFEYVHKTSSIFCHILFSLTNPQEYLKNQVKDNFEIMTKF